MGWICCENVARCKNCNSLPRDNATQVLPASKSCHSDSRNNPRDKLDIITFRMFTLIKGASCALGAKCHNKHPRRMLPALNKTFEIRIHR